MIHRRIPNMFVLERCSPNTITAVKTQANIPKVVQIVPILPRDLLSFKIINQTAVVHMYARLAPTMRASLDSEIQRLER
jgi:hypothetical protein